MQRLILAVVVAGTTLFAGTISAAKKPASPYAVEIKELHVIKVLLERADRDYKGHRAEAVKQISEAIHALSAGKKHNGKGVKGGNEPQALSDAQLRESIAALAKVQTQLVATGGAPAVLASEHIARAIKQLEIALTIK
jgi:hypothetical protein